MSCRHKGPPPPQGRVFPRAFAMQRQCPTCKQVLDISCFGSAKGVPHARPTCKACNNAASRRSVAKAKARAAEARDSTRAPGRVETLRAAAASLGLSLEALQASEEHVRRMPRAEVVEALRGVSRQQFIAAFAALGMRLAWRKGEPRRPVMGPGTDRLVLAVLRVTTT